MSKKILSFQQNHEGVMVRFSDNSTTHGDILVGADGAHSAVRQHLYKTLDKQGLLPKADTKAMSRGYISLVGTTRPLDPVKYPSVLKDDCETSFILGDKNSPYTVSKTFSRLVGSYTKGWSAKCSRYHFICSFIVVVGDLHNPWQ